MDFEPIKTVVEYDGKTIESHPCFGAIHLSKINGNKKLFGSAVDGHAGYVSLTISTAERMHDYSKDHIFARKDIIRVTMSHSQFAEMITTWNTGEGIPVTIERTREGKYVGVPQLMKNDNSECNRAENAFRESVNSRIQSFKKSKEKITEILNKKSISKSDRTQIEAIFNGLESWLDDAAPYAVKTFFESLERAKQKAKTEIEAFVSNVIQKTGMDSLKQMKLEGTTDNKELPEKINKHDQEKYKYWKEEYGFEEDPLYSWVEFRDKFLWCNLCKSWQEGQCICYAR